MILDAPSPDPYVTVFWIAKALRFLDLAWPDWNRSTDMPDEAGKPWWPSTWKAGHPSFEVQF